MLGVARYVRLGAWLLLATWSGGCSPEDPEPEGIADGAGEAAPTAPFGPPPRFDTRIELDPGAGETLGLLAGDVTGDGAAELICAVRSPGALLIWRRLPRSANRGTPPTTVEVGGYPLGPVWVGEPAPDGPALVAVASMAENNLELVDLRRLAEAGAHRRIELSGRSSALTAGDLGADGVVEVVVALEDGRWIAIAPDGAPGAELVEASLPGSRPTCLRVLRDGSGLAAGLQDSRSLAWQPWPVGDGEGARTIELDGIPRDIEEIDLDLDGDLELVVAGGDRWLWVFGWGDDGDLGEAGARPRRLGVGAIPLDVEVADVDADGDEELVLLHYADLDVQVLDDFGPGGPATRLRVPMGQMPWDAAVADLDGDGILDLAATNTDTGHLSLVFGAGSGRFRLGGEVRCGRAPRGLAVGDLDEDGRPEVLSLSAVDGHLTVMAGEGQALEVRQRVATGGDADAVRCADLDGDGHLDAAFLCRPGPRAGLVFLFGDGSGQLSERPQAAPVPVGKGLGDLLLEDLDGDGAVEAAVSDPVSGRLTLLRGGGEGAIPGRLAPTASVAVEGSPEGVAFLTGGSGEEALLAVTIASPPELRGARLYAIEPDPAGGERLAPRGFLATELSACDATAADLDGDGREDLAVLTRALRATSLGRVRIFLRREDGWEPLERLVTSQMPFHVTSGDVDGDGRADLLVAAQSSHLVNLWLNRWGQEPSFHSQPHLGCGNGPIEPLLCDLDGDGRLDLLVANHWSDSVSAILNPAR